MSHLNPPFSEALKIVRSVKTHKSAWPFLGPVDPVGLGIPDYFEVIKEPSDLQTIEDKLLNGSYSTLEDFHYDMELIWNNAVKYNGAAHEVSKLGISLKGVFDKRFSVLKKKESGGGQQRPKKNSSSKAKSKNAIEMTVEEKRNLCILINKIEPKNLGKVIQIIHNGNPDFFKTTNQDVEEIEIDLDSLQASVLRELERFVNSQSNV